MNSNGRMDRRQFLRLASAAAGLGYAPRSAGPTPARAGARAPALPWQPGAARLAERTLLLHGAPFQGRGVIYQPTPAGQAPSGRDGSFTPYSHPRGYRPEFPRRERLGGDA